MSAQSSALSQSRASGLVSSCAVCHRAIALTRAGVIRQHGPVVSHCPGSGRPPAIPPPSGPPSHDSSQTQADSTHLPLTTTLPPRPTVKILKSFPQASRELSGKKLATILEAVVKNNDHNSWNRLFGFSARCLRHPSSARGGRRWSLAMAVNSQLREEAAPPSSPPSRSRQRGSQSSPQDILKSLASRVSVKLEQGDFKGAIRLACSDDMLADMSDATFASIQQKHPTPHPDSVISPHTGDLPSPVAVSEEDVSQAVQSFPNGSAGGGGQMG